MSSCQGLCRWLLPHLVRARPLRERCPTGPWLALREAFRRGSLVPVEVPELDLRRQFQFVTHARKYVTAGMGEFIALCRQLSAGATRSDEIELPFIP